MNIFTTGDFYNELVLDVVALNALAFLKQKPAL